MRRWPLSEHFRHWREILRRWTEPDTNANTYSDPNRDSYADSNSDCNANSYADGDRYSDGYGYGDGDRFSDGNCNGNTHGNPENRSHVKTSADARTAAVGCANWNYCSGIDLFAPAYSVYRPARPCRSRPRGSIL